MMIIELNFFPLINILKTFSLILNITSTAIESQIQIFHIIKTSFFSVSNIKKNDYSNVM